MSKNTSDSEHRDLAHRPYVEAVAAALATAGVGIAELRIEPDVRRWAELQLSEATSNVLDPYGRFAVYLFWNEVDGWFYQTYRRTKKPEETVSAYAGVLPTPADVVTWFLAEMAGAERVLPEILQEEYRDGAHEDPEFERQLAAYAR